MYTISNQRLMELDSPKPCLHVFEPELIVFKAKPVKGRFSGVASYPLQHISPMHDHGVYVVAQGQQGNIPVRQIFQMTIGPVFMGKDEPLAVDERHIILRLLQGSGVFFQAGGKDNIVSVKDEQVWRLRAG